MVKNKLDNHFQGVKPKSKSFINNCLRLSLIPILISYFEDQEIRVRWHGMTTTNLLMNFPLHFKQEIASEIPTLLFLAKI